MKIVIVGNGIWGKALKSVLPGSETSFWERNTSIENADMLVLAVPTPAIREVMGHVKPHKELIVVNSSKGIEEDTHLLPYQILKDITPDVHYFSLMGPSFAQEVIDNMPTMVNLGFCKSEFVDTVQQLFQTDYFRVRPISGVEAIELAAAFKNIYALLCGMVEGLEFGDNTRTKVILMAFEEIQKINKNLGHSITPDAVSGVIGDLMLTGSSTESRNYSFGKALVSLSIEDALRASKGVVEGWNSLKSVSYFSEKTGEELALAQLIQTLSGHATNALEMKKLFLEYVKYV